MAKKGEVKVYFCPRCKSTDVKYTFRTGNLFGVVPRQECKECKLKALTFPILVIDKKKLNSEVKKKGVKKK